MQKKLLPLIALFALTSLSSLPSFPKPRKLFAADSIELENDTKKAEQFHKDNIKGVADLFTTCFQETNSSAQECRDIIRIALVREMQKACPNWSGFAKDVALEKIMSDKSLLTKNEECALAEKQRFQNKLDTFTVQ